MVARSQFLSAASLFTLDVDGLGEQLRVLRFTGHEGMSSLFDFQVEFVCEDPSVDLSAIAGKSARLVIMGEQGPRFVQGLVSRLEQLNELPRYAIYQATLVPQVWRLLHRHDCRIFQQLATPDILKKVFEKAGISSDLVRYALTSSYEPRDYCVQYRESDWAFISRLMEEDGMSYFFEHLEDKAVLVVGDGISASKPIPGSELLQFRRPSSLVVTEDHIERFRFSEEVQPGRTSLRDFNFKQPTMLMHVEQTAKADTDLEVYDYPGEYQDPGRGSSAKGVTISRLRLEAWQAARRVGTGESDCERLCPGFLFTLGEHSRADYNARYLLTSVSHQGHQPQVLDEEAPEGEFSYSNHFSCIAEKTPFRPARMTPRPVMRGVQTAIVVGSEGEEIYTDEYGRVKVQFHWDRDGMRDEKSSCWVRVSQLWAGEGWGGMFIPRIGQEVIVDFIEGDPDRPIITGRVYNGKNPPPYTLPDEKTKSTIKSDSSLKSDGYNELRFEDKKGSEQVFIHAQRNMDVHVKNDSLENILHDRHQTIGGEGKNGKVGDQNEMVYRDKSLTVHRNSQEHVGGDMKLLVGGIDGPGNLDIVLKADRKELVHGSGHLHVKGGLNEKVDGTYSLTLGGMQVSIKGMHGLAATDEIHLMSKKVVIEAEAEMTLKGPGGFITINAEGIAISGKLVKINSGGAAVPGTEVKPAKAEDAAEAKPTKPTSADSGK